VCGIKRQHWSYKPAVNAQLAAKSLTELVLLCLANASLFYIFRDCTRPDRDRKSLPSSLECNLAKLGLLLLLLLLTWWRKQAAALPLLLPLPAEAKLWDRSRSGIERASLSLSTDRSTHKAQPKEKPDKHHIIAFRNNDHRLLRNDVPSLRHATFGAPWAKRSAQTRQFKQNDVFRTRALRQPNTACERAFAVLWTSH
jgi:hypothetical protein